MDFKKDYYAVLGVNQSSRKEEIRIAYRKLAMKYHPDRNQRNKECEEICKEVNEAYEVLEDNNQRFIYDEYRNNAFKESSDEHFETQESNKESVKKPNTRTYKVTKKIQKEIKVYVKGEVSIKFHGQLVDALSIDLMREAYYRIYATDTIVYLNEEQSSPFSLDPQGHKNIYSETDLFQMPIKQPLKCHIQSDGKEEFYELKIIEIHVVNPRILDVTKNEGETFGTLRGDLYGVIQHFQTEEIDEYVSECFGETGKTEIKLENGREFFRKEYYYKDGTTYWSHWEKRAGNKYSQASTDKTTDRFFNYTNWFWLLCGIFLLFLVPRLFLVFLITGGIIFLLLFWSSIITFLALFLRIIGWLSLLFFIAFSFKACWTENGQNILQPHPVKNSIIKTTNTPVTITRNNKQTDDSIISHSMVWNDFNNNRFTGVLSIYKSDLRISSQLHSQMNYIITSKEGFSTVYQYLYDIDQGRLNFVYSLFDSIRNERKLNERDFANMIVSCIQYLPYTLVLESSCNDTYNDEDIRSYLAKCSSDCCVGYEKYGVRSPVEFLSDLKGDCDTRALLLFALFKHFGYDIALLTSIKYKHSLIAIHFKSDSIINGVDKIINNKIYLLWETTSPGFRPGILPYDISNINYWNISLLSEN